MNKNLDRLPLKTLRILEPLFVSGEKLLAVFHESFNWDAVRTRIVLTNKRVFVISYYPFAHEINEYDFMEFNIEYRQDDIGPYDAIDFRKGEDTVREIAVYRGRRNQAKNFVHLVSETISQINIRGKETSSENYKTNFLDNCWYLGLLSAQEYVERKLMG